jgi:hypothetical protein
MRKSTFNETQIVGILKDAETGVAIGRDWRLRWAYRCPVVGWCVLNVLVALHGRPTAIRVDNCPEFTAQLFVDWCAGWQRTTSSRASRSRTRTSLILLRFAIRLSAQLVVRNLT